MLVGALGAARWLQQAAGEGRAGQVQALRVLERLGSCPRAHQQLDALAGQQLVDCLVDCAKPGAEAG